MNYTNNILENHPDILQYIKDNQDLQHLLLNDPETKYECSIDTKSKNSCHLHKLVLETRKHEFLLHYLKLLLESEHQLINLQDQEGWSALMYACCNSNTDSNLETVKLLIKNGADINLQEEDGWTALMLACRYSNTDSNVETVKLLIEYQADINIQDPDGWAALMLSFPTNNLEIIDNIVNMFIKNGYVINKQEIYNFVIKFDQEIIVIDYLIDNKYLDYDGNLLKKYKNSKYNIMIPYYIFKKYNIITNECMICCNDTDCIKCNFDHYTCFMCLNKSNNKCHGCQLEL